MIRKVILALALCVLALPARADSIIGALPYTLTNGATADANQVMANYNAIISGVNTYAAANGANSSITSLSGLTTPLSLSQGGTGTTNGLPLGVSTSAASPSISGDATTGLYTAGAAKVDVSISGVKTMEINSSGVSISAGNLTVASGNLTLSSGNITVSGSATISGLSTGVVQSSSLGVLSSSAALANGTTATTQSAADSSTKVATDSFVNGTALTLTNGTTAVTQSPGDSSTDVSNDAFVIANRGFTSCTQVTASGSPGGTSTETATCSSGYTMTGGGCQCTSGCTLNQSYSTMSPGYPSASNAYSCGGAGNSVSPTFTVTAICCH